MLNELDRIQRWAPVCEAVSRLLSPHAEVVLHDPLTDRMMAIWSPLSPRSPGDPSLLAQLGNLDGAEANVFGPYPKSLADGRTLSSVSSVLRDSAGNPEVVLCINVDRTAFQEAARILAAFAAPAQPQPHELFEHDWTESVHELISDYVRTTGTTIERFNRSDRLKILARLDAAGIFGRKRSMPIVARILQVSRSSIYDALAESRREEEPTHDDAS